MIKNHSFHLVDPSPWPLIISFTLLSSTLNMLLFFNQKNSYWMILSLVGIFLIMMIWWRDIQRESTLQGHHTMKVYLSMKYGMILFISSEIFFFISFFWSFFHHSLTPNIELNMLWPPSNIQTFNPMHVPLINTLILLSSGISVTWTHNSMCMNNFSQTKMSLFLTILLGIYFSILQGYEYWSASFCLSDSIYGSSFFLTTGFHGIHVLIGTMFLIHMFYRLNILHFSSTHHFGLEAAIWYWHFVDVVWLFLYMTLYWWSK